jgi:hypothetical protein
MSLDFMMNSYTAYCKTNANIKLSQTRDLFFSVLKVTRFICLALFQEVQGKDGKSSSKLATCIAKELPCYLAAQTQKKKVFHHHKN